MNYIEDPDSTEVFSVIQAVPDHYSSSLTQTLICSDIVSRKTKCDLREVLEQFDVIRLAYCFDGRHETFQKVARDIVVHVKRVVIRMADARPKELCHFPMASAYGATEALDSRIMLIPTKNPSGPPRLFLMPVHGIPSPDQEQLDDFDFSANGCGAEGRRVNVQKYLTIIAAYGIDLTVAPVHTWKHLCRPHPAGFEYPFLNVDMITLRVSAPCYQVHHYTRPRRLDELHRPRPRSVDTSGIPGRQPLVPADASLRAWRHPCHPRDVPGGPTPKETS